MTPLEAAVLVALLALPLHLLVQWQLDRMGALDLRAVGIVIVKTSVLEARHGKLGNYLGSPIWESVTFKGLRYRFDHIARPEEKEKTGPGELYLDPGLVYVAI